MRAISRAPDSAALQDGALLGVEVSQKLCAPSCKAYHGVWVLMRLLGLLPSVERDHDSLLGSIGAEVRRGARRVLIAGAADFGILAYVLEAFSREGVQPNVTVADLCPTPLALNEWFAGRCGARIATAAGDIRKLNSGPFDLVVAHNFLNFFDDEGRLATIAGWARMLAPGGRILLFARIREGAGEPRARRFGEDTARMLLAGTLEAWRALPDRPSIDEGVIAGLVAEFAEKRVRHNIRSVEEVRRPFEQAGLNILGCDYVVAPTLGLDFERPSRKLLLVAEKASERPHA